MSDDPRELFGLRLSHIGINAASQQESLDIANKLQAMLGLGLSATPVSHFVGTYVEIMNQPGRGTNGHIGFHVDDVKKAVAWFAARGFKVDEDSWLYRPDGSARLVYFEDEIAGFAIHLTSEE